MTAASDVPVTREELAPLLHALSGYLEAASRADASAEERRDRAEEARYTVEALEMAWELTSSAGSDHDNE